MSVRSRSLNSHTRLAALGAAATLALAACAGGHSATGVGMGMTGHKARPGQEQPPVRTTVADWKPVSDTLGRTGTLMDGTVYRIPLTRKDLAVTTRGVKIKPGLALGGYATFAKYRDGTMAMGDLVVTEDELPRITDVLQRNGIAQTALHKHLLQQSPPVWWAHVHAMGDPVKVAQGLKAALAVTATPPASKPPATQPPIDLDSAGIDKAIGRHGTADGGIYKFTIPRKDTISDGDGHTLPAALGLTTAINFQPLGGKQAAINGDFVMTAPEIQKVIQALRNGGITIVELHNHSLDEQPRLFYMHFWATGDGVKLAQALRPALDATNLTPATR